MPLSEDQKAMLRLLAQRGEQGYEDIAALKGVSVDEVRAQAREAVRQLEEEGLPPPALPLEPAPTTPAAEPRQEAKPRREPRRDRETVGWRPSGISLPRNPLARVAIAAAAAAVVIVVAVVLIGGGGDGDDGDAQGAAGNAAGGNGAADREVTKAVLRPVDGGGASGEATFGRIEDSLALGIGAEGLQPTGSGQSYTIWLAQSPKRMLPLAFTPVKQNGEIDAQFQVPTEVLAYLAAETFDRIVLTRTNNAQLTASLKKATNRKRAPSYTGERVLEGTVTGPIVGAALREEEGKGGGGAGGGE